MNAASILKGFRENEKENTPALLRGLTKNKVKTKKILFFSKPFI